MYKLKLYYKPTCPYCQKVLHFLKKKNIELPLRNVDADSDGRKELIKIGGKAQIPCLVIDGRALYESDEIIEWMEKNIVEKQELRSKK